ncbi:hypothetical protein H072_3546 [Dactylellina haptotyla CBS 200.50]|uniref:GATA-type domain-containing protein n=1 Tax=Dactylellina haptotyla (strain CBS 200.50) TaxID=1284197 RepID=S8AMT2_DACHA|nr:hypothetical protein H072_3546 [Dactylellina haptotyla CBS 200.50]
MAKKPSKYPPGSALDSEADTPGATTPSASAPAAPTPQMIAVDATRSPAGPPPPRPMRLKVLYSLDDLLPNCLARAKEVVHVRVAHLDESTPIGFVDLKTCVLNIVYSSPEIMHHQGCDYSVYSYDYSEPETPMTGLGLLSWVLSLPALNGQQPDPEAIDPAQASRLVTGRVQKNLFGLYAGDVGETLEVRMRLCRVPTLRQVDYLNHMNQYQQLSRSIPPGVDPASVWTNGIISQSGVGSQSPYAQPHGLPGGMPQYPQMPYMPQGAPGYPPMGPFQQPTPGHMGQSPQPYPQQYPAQAPQHPQQPYQGQSHSLQEPMPPGAQYQAQQGDVAEGGAPTGLQTIDGVSPAPPSQIQQTQDATTSIVATGETRKEDQATDQAQPAAKKRKVAPKKPTGKPRGRPRLTDIRRANPDVQPSSREGLPQDPAAADAPPIKQAPTPSSVAPSPSLTSVSTSNLNHTSTSNQGAGGSPHPSLSQATPIPAPSSAAPSPITLVPIVTDNNDMATQLSSMTPTNEDRDVEMIQDNDNDADTEVAESPRDSDIDSLFIGSSPPPTHSEASEQNPTSPVVDTSSPVLPRQPSKGFFPSQPRQSSINLQEALSREGSEDESSLPTVPLLLPMTKSVDEPMQDKNSPSEKGLSPKEVDESASSTSQTAQNAPKKRGRPPKNPALKSDGPKKEKEKDKGKEKDKERKEKEKEKDKEDPEKKTVVKTDPLPSDAPVPPTSPVEPKTKPKRPPPAPMPIVAPPPLPPGLIFPVPPPKENDQPTGKKRRSSDAGSDTETAPAKRGSTTALVRARIERQMLEKIAAGEMPTYCMHCGAIETPTWRKAKVMMTDPETGDEVEREVTLCNPCGLWHHNHGTMRPEQFWDKMEGEEKAAKPKKKARKRASLSKQGSITSTVGISTLSRQNSTAYPSSPPSRERRFNGHRATSPPVPSGGNGAEDWDQAVNKNLRRIQSSPCGLGTVAQPISLLSPDQKTRRKLFPEARRTTTGLDGEPIPEVEEGDEEVEAKAELMSPDEPVGSPEMEKENHPPPVDVTSMEMDWERELERTLMKANDEAEAAEVAPESTTPEEEEEEEEKTNESESKQPEVSEIVRPQTPENQISPPHMEFKTPIRLTPLLASINVDSPSFWKSGLLGVATPSGKIISAHPTPTPGKLLMNMVSPATGEIMLEFLNEWNKTEEIMGPASPTPVNGIDEDNDDTHDAFFSEINIEAVEEELGLTSEEGNAMPSSPPAMFNLYDEEPGSLIDAVSSSLFSDVLPTSPGTSGTYRLDLSNLETDKEAAEKEEKDAVIDLNFDFDSALVVDFSDLVSNPAAAKVAAIGAANAVIGSTDKVACATVASEKKDASEDDSSSTEGK